MLPLECVGQNSSTNSYLVPVTSQVGAVIIRFLESQIMRHTRLLPPHCIPQQRIMSRITTERAGASKRPASPLIVSSSLSIFLMGTYRFVQFLARIVPELMSRILFSNQPLFDLPAWFGEPLSPIGFPAGRCAQYLPIPEYLLLLTASLRLATVRSPIQVIHSRSVGPPHISGRPPKATAKNDKTCMVKVIPFATPPHGDRSEY